MRSARWGVADQFRSPGESFTLERSPLLGLAEWNGGGNVATNTVMTDEANELDAGVEILVEEVSIDGLCGVY